MKLSRLTDLLLDEMNDEGVLAFAEGYNSEKMRTEPSNSASYPANMLSRLFKIAGEKPPVELNLESQQIAYAKPKEVGRLLAKGKLRLRRPRSAS